MTNTNNNNFFGQLKSVCRNIEQGIRQLQNEVETKTSSRSTGNAVLKLKNLKQEIQDMKVEGRQKSQVIDEEGKNFEELLSCCRSLIDIQSHKLQNIEIFMKQYGYKNFISKESEKQEVAETETECEDETKENKDPVTPPRDDRPKKMNTTPKLEDFGLSSPTLKAMMKGFNFVQQDFTTSVTPPQDDRPNKMNTPKPEDFGFSTNTLKAMERGFNTMQGDFTTRSVAKSQERIPSVFNQDDIVSLTPSVFGRHVPFHTPGKHQDASPSLHDLLTPWERKVSGIDKTHQSDLPKFNLGDDSPDATVFQTPGTKHTGDKEDFQNKNKPVSAFKKVQKSQTNASVPVFQNDYVKKIEYGQMPKDIKPLTEMRGHDVTMNTTPTMPEILSNRYPHIASSGQDQLRDLSRTPPPPDFLSKYKLQEIGLGNEPQHIKQEPLERNRTPTFDYKEYDQIKDQMSKDIKPLTEMRGHDVTMNTTPTMPEILSNRYPHIASSGQDQPMDLSRTPPMPKFLSEYMNKLAQESDKN